MNKSIIKTLIIILFYIKSNYVYSIVNIVVSGNPGTMTISTATAGEQPDSVQEGTTTYGVQVIGDKAGIFGSINSNMPTETSLYVQLEPPNKATSTGSRPVVNRCYFACGGYTTRDLWTFRNWI